MVPARKSDLIPKAAYDLLLGEISGVIERARNTASRAINSAMTATYWLVGFRIVEFEENGKARAKYGSNLINELALDLTKTYGRGFGVS